MLIELNISFKCLGEIKSSYFEYNKERFGFLVYK